MATTVSHPVPSVQAQAIADLTGYEDAATLRWQQACVQAANTLTALPNGRYVKVTYRKIKRYFATVTARHMQRSCNGKAARPCIPHVASAFPSQFFACIVYICAVC